MHKFRIKRIVSFLLAIIITLGSMPIEVFANSNTNLNRRSDSLSLRATPTDYGVFKNVSHTLTLDPGSDQLCKRNMTGEITFDWPEPSTYVDVVFIQDFSGSFDATIADVGEAVKTMVGSLNMGTDIDGTSPKDRAMIVTYQGIQGTAIIYNDGYTSYTQSSGAYGVYPSLYMIEIGRAHV